MSNRLAPIVVPVLVDSSGVDKGMRTAKNKMRSGAVAAGGAGIIGGGDGGGGAGFASMAFASAVGARVGASGSKKGWRKGSGRFVSFREELNRSTAGIDVFEQGISGEEIASRLGVKIAAAEDLRNIAANRARLTAAVGRGMRRRNASRSLLGNMGTQPGRVIGSIAGSLGVKEAFRAVGPVGLGVGAAALATAKLGNYGQDMLGGVGNLPMNYRLNSPQFGAALDMKRRWESTERPEAGFGARFAISNPSASFGMDFLSTILGGVFSAETLGRVVPGGSDMVKSQGYADYWSQRWNAFTTRNWGTPKELMDLRNEQRRQSRIMNRTAI